MVDMDLFGGAMSPVILEHRDAFPFSVSSCRYCLLWKEDRVR